MRFTWFKGSASGAAAGGDVPFGDNPEADDRLPDSGEPAACGFVVYTTLLDPKKQAVGYRMAWCPQRVHADASPATALGALVACVAEHFNPGRVGWRMGKTTVFLDVSADTLLSADLASLPPEHVVLCLGPEEIVAENVRPTLLSLRQQGFGFMLCDAQALPEEPEVGDLITHFDVGGGEADLIAGIRRSQPPSRAPIHLLGTRMAGWPGFEACAARRVPVFVGAAAGSPPVKEPGRALQPEALLIVRVMQMIQRNEDVREIEAALKHDAALSYRLLRHINSPVIGAGVEIHSLRHAVAMLGYSPLFRWLSLLLATSNTKSSPPFLMKKAIMRGRFVELLGHTLLGASHTDNLFVAGMFSMIDQLLGVAMEEVLGKIQLTEPVQQAILKREGVYGPFLLLAETCESDGSQAERLADDLLMDACQVNAAHLSAMVWAQEVSPVEAPY